MSLCLCGSALAQEDDPLAEVLKAAKPVATAPADPVPETAPGDPLGTLKSKPNPEARVGSLALSSGKRYEGRIWTTLQTPFRVWLEDARTYRDIDFALVDHVDVVVEAAGLEDDWRWLKEGSDQKIYSGKKYPNVSLRYKFTLLNNQVIDGTIVAPVYVQDGPKTHALALYKKYKGKLDEKMDDVIYITHIKLQLSNTTATANEKKTTRLPLIEDGY